MVSWRARWSGVRRPDRGGGWWASRHGGLVPILLLSVLGPILSSLLLPPILPNNDPTHVRNVPDAMVPNARVRILVDPTHAVRLRQEALKENAPALMKGRIVSR